MESPRDPFATALILKADRLYAEVLRSYALRVAPSAKVTVVSSLEAAKQALIAQPADVFITGVGASLDEDVLSFLLQRSKQRPPKGRVLVVTASREGRALTALRTLGVEGVFDSRIESPENLSFALRAVALGARYWSASVIEFIQHDVGGPRALAKILTAFEQVVLCVIGDGSDDLTASQELGVSPATICTVRRELHRKLRVQHRGALVRAAAQYGFVRFTPHGVVRPGFALLTAAYRPKKPRITKVDGAAVIF